MPHLKARKLTLQSLEGVADVGIERVVHAVFGTNTQLVVETEAPGAVRRVDAELSLDRVRVDDADRVGSRSGNTSETELKELLKN